MKRYSVYTYYGVDGVPLYIGKSKEIHKRHIAHKNDEWMQYAGKIGVRSYSNEREMDMAEIYYIASKHPKYNVKSQSKSDFAEDSMQIRFEDASVEEIYTLNEFCDIYGSKVNTEHNVSMPRKRNLTPEGKTLMFHKDMQATYGNNIIVLSEPTIGSICSIFSTIDRIIRVGNDYYGSGYAFLTEEERNKRKTPKPPSEETRKRFVAEWLAAGNEHKFVKVKVMLADQEDYVIPILYHKSIDERGGKAFGFQCLGDGIMEFFPTSNTMIYELPSIESVLGYMKTKNERLIRPIKE